MSFDSVALKVKKYISNKNNAPSWSRNRNIIFPKIVEEMGLNEKDFEIIYNEHNALDKLTQIIVGSFFPIWGVRDIYFVLLERFPHHGERILTSNNSPFFLKSWVVSKGYYENISSIDFLILEKEKNIRALGAKICDIEKCKNLIFDKEAAVRKIAYIRLGPVNYLDFMLKDKHAVIRSMGVGFAPMHYAKLNDLLDDSSQMVLNLLIDKVQYEKVPFLLGSRSLLKQSDRTQLYLKSKIEKRLERGV